MTTPRYSRPQYRPPNQQQGGGSGTWVTLIIFGVVVLQVLHSPMQEMFSSFKSFSVFSKSDTSKVPSYRSSPRVKGAELAPEFYVPQGGVFTPNMTTVFQAHIEEDLAPYAQSGITKEMVDVAEAAAAECEGDTMRVVISGQVVFVNHTTPRKKSGWYPASEGKGAAASGARVPYVLLMLLNTLWRAGAEIPNAEFVVHTGDKPCITKDRRLPVFSFSTGEGFSDIPIPDWSFFGNLGDQLRAPDGEPMQQWGKQVQYMQQKWLRVLLADRMRWTWWNDAPTKQPLEQDFVKLLDSCKSNWKSLLDKGQSMANPLSHGKDKLAMHDACDVRFPLIADTDGYAVDAKYKMSCGSLPLVVKRKYQEWWSRGLKPGLHYVELDPDNLCQDLARTVSSVNEVIDEQQAVFKDFVRRYGMKVAKMRSTGKDPGVLEEISARVQSDPTTQWGTNLTPFEIALASQAFMQFKVTYDEAIVYLKELIRQYAALQHYKAMPPLAAKCYTGPLVLRQFAKPYEDDAKLVESHYAWLKDITPWDCEKWNAEQ